MLDLPRGILLAVAVHGSVIFAGGFLFQGHKTDHGSLQQVQLISENDIKTEKEKDIEEVPQELQEMETEEAPDAAEVVKSLEAQVANNSAPALEAASLSDIEAALSGTAGGGGGDFANAMDFASGGRIGGTGKAGVLGENGMDGAFSLAEIDQKPRAIFQAVPVFPSAMRSQKSEGIVTILFIVDPTGKVLNPKVEKSSHPAYEKPALDAVKQWKFEAAVKGGQRVACKMRVPIRFQPK